MKIEDLSFRLPGPRIGESEIRAAETALALRLPEDYCGFLLLHNGGGSQYYETEDGLIGLHHWLAITENLTRPVQSLVSTNLKMAAQFPHWKGYVLFAYAISEQHVIMSVSGQNTGRVGLFDWQTEEDVRKTKLPYASFTDFVAHLRPAKM